MYIIYIYDHNNEEWVCDCTTHYYSIATMRAGYLALNGYDVSLVNTETSQFEYFWSMP